MDGVLGTPAPPAAGASIGEAVLETRGRLVETQPRTKARVREKRDVRECIFRGWRLRGGAEELDRMSTVSRWEAIDQRERVSVSAEHMLTLLEPLCDWTRSRMWLR